MLHYRKKSLIPLLTSVYAQSAHQRNLNVAPRHDVGPTDCGQTGPVGLFRIAFSILCILKML